MRILIDKKALIVLVLCLMISLSCGGKVTTRTPPSDYKFTVNGVVVKDKNLDKDFAYFNVRRDSDPFDGAVVKAGAYTLTSQGDGDYYKEGSSLFSFGQNVSITVTSSADNFNLTTSVVMPGSFQITSINHPTFTASQADEVIIYFSGSENATGYFKSIIRPDGSNGNTTVVTGAEFGQTGIDPDAFYEGQSFITGTYQVFLIAYGVSFVSYPDMGFFLPDGLPQGNVSGANGTIGAGVIAPSNTIVALAGQ
jgi:hypothetical protein